MMKYNFELNFNAIINVNMKSRNLENNVYCYTDIHTYLLI